MKYTTAVTFLDKSEFVTNFYNSRLPYVLHSDTTQEKVILLWTPFFYSSDGWFSFYGTNKQNECPYKCTVSTSRDLNDKADALLFNERDLYKASMLSHMLPQSVRKSHQIWIFHNTEPPWFTWTDLDSYKNIFNWTSTLRHDSDIPTYYGKIVQRKNTAKFDRNTDYSTGKINRAAWMATNCNSNNNRDLYVRNLGKYFPVDTYGECGKLSCPKGFDNNCTKRLKTYKFYLAFENANCRNYVTEKFWGPLAHNTIPVVKGESSAYRQVAPPASYIDTADFRSHKELADYLYKVATDKELYNSYFNWKSNYDIQHPYLCDLCKTLHQWKGPNQVYHDLTGWFKQDYCQTFNVRVHNIMYVKVQFNTVIKGVNIVYVAEDTREKYFALVSPQPPPPSTGL